MATFDRLSLSDSHIAYRTSGADRGHCGPQARAMPPNRVALVTAEEP